jgi:hypothetical protein
MSYIYLEIKVDKYLFHNLNGEYIVLKDFLGFFHLINQFHIDR